MYVFQILIMTHLKCISNHEDHLENQNLEIFPIIIIEQCCHMLIFLIFTCVINIRDQTR